jgi:hypothetical protein
VKNDPTIKAKDLYEELKKDIREINLDKLEKNQDGW